MDRLIPPGTQPNSSNREVLTVYLLSANPTQIQGLLNAYAIVGGRVVPDDTLTNVHLKVEAWVSHDGFVANPDTPDVTEEHDGPAILMFLMGIVPFTLPTPQGAARVRVTATCDQSYFLDGVAENQSSSLRIVQ